MPSVSTASGVVVVTRTPRIPQEDTRGIVHPLAPSPHLHTPLLPISGGHVASLGASLSRVGGARGHPIGRHWGESSAFGVASRYPRYTRGWRLIPSDSRQRATQKSWV